jgi:hypothetical protein
LNKADYNGREWSVACPKGTPSNYFMDKEIKIPESIIFIYIDDFNRKIELVYIH